MIIQGVKQYYKNVHRSHRHIDWPLVENPCHKAIAKATSIHHIEISVQNYWIICEFRHTSDEFWIKRKDLKQRKNSRRVKHASRRTHKGNHLLVSCMQINCVPRVCSRSMSTLQQKCANTKLILPWISMELRTVRNSDTSRTCNFVRCIPIFM